MNKFYKVTEWMPGIYRITSAEQVYMELFVGSENALLLDTGYGYGNLKETVRSITNLPLYIVNSHGHLDHSCGNYQFEETIYIHEKDMELCRQHNTALIRGEAVKGAKNTVDYISGTSKNILPASFCELSYLEGGSGKLQSVSEGYIFDIGGKKFRVVELPGHTPGSIGLIYEEEKVLFCGDAMNRFFWLFLPESLQLSDYRKTLEKAENLEIEKIVMAHEENICGKDLLKDLIDTASEVDFEHGHPFSSWLAPDVQARICPRRGYSMGDFANPGFASIVISREHMN